jgi:hypothetical protein
MIAVIRLVTILLQLPNTIPGECELLEPRAQSFKSLKSSYNMRQHHFRPCTRCSSENNIDESFPFGDQDYVVHGSSHPAVQRLAVVKQNKMQDLVALWGEMAYLSIRFHGRV